MTIFSSEMVEQRLEKYFSILKDLAFASFEEYQEICTEKATPYAPLTRANMIRDHFKKRLTHSNMLGGENNYLEESNNTFYMYLEGLPITFNKLDKDKRKSKDVEDTSMNFAYNFEQLSLLECGIPITQNRITKETPLTFGYILNKIGTEIVGLYLTYQIGKTVLWYKKVDVIIPIATEEDETSKPKITRVK